MTKTPKTPKDVHVEIKRLVERLNKSRAGRPGRDPKRIVGLLKILETIWRKDPDMRLGQLIANATRYSRPSFVCPEIFHLEDDAMLKGFEQMLKNRLEAEAAYQKPTQKP